MITKVTATVLSATMNIPRDSARLILDGIEAAGKATRSGRRRTFTIHDDGTVSPNVGRHQICYDVDRDVVAALFGSNLADQLDLDASQAEADHAGLELRYATQPKPEKVKLERVAGEGDAQPGSVAA